MPSSHRVAPRVCVFASSCFLALAAHAQGVAPSLVSDLSVHYDFEHPVAGNAALEADQGLSGTPLMLVNGGAAMRVADGAWAGSATSLQTQQLNGTANDDWKAGVYDRPGVATLNAFNATAGTTIMGWVKPTGTNPNLNTGTANPNDFYNAVGLMGILSGNSNGHDVRALLEVIDVSGTLKLVALGRRIDGASSLTFAASQDWHDILPTNQWTHIAATFDFDNGTMALYRNGAPLAGAYTSSADAWNVIGGPEPDLTSATNPSGIKIGGSYPQDSQEFNAFNGRFDELMFFDRSLSPDEVALQFQVFAVPEPETYALMLAGLALVGAVARRRNGERDAAGPARL